MQALAPSVAGPWSPTPTIATNSRSQSRHISMHSLAPPWIFHGLGRWSVQPAPWLKKRARARVRYRRFITGISFAGSSETAPAVIRLQQKASEVLFPDETVGAGGIFGVCSGHPRW